MPLRAGQRTSKEGRGGEEGCIIRQHAGAGDGDATKRRGVRYRHMRDVVRGVDVAKPVTVTDSTKSGNYY